MLLHLIDMPKGVRLCKILTADKIRRKSVRVTPQEMKKDTFQYFLWQMVRACLTDDGVGLAAPQIGVFKQVFIMRESPEAFQVIVNPILPTRYGQGSETALEGCLSVPGRRRPVTRFTKIQVSSDELQEDGTVLTTVETLEGFPARVFQHEFDHLQGISILERSQSQSLKYG